MEMEYLLKHSEELSKKYSGRCIAVVKDEVVAIGRDRIEAYKEAKKKHPHKKLPFFISLQRMRRCRCYEISLCELCG